MKASYVLAVLVLALAVIVGCTENKPSDPEPGVTNTPTVSPTSTQTATATFTPTVFVSLYMNGSVNKFPYSNAEYSLNINVASTPVANATVYAVKEPSGTPVYMDWDGGCKCYITTTNTEYTVGADYTMHVSFDGADFSATGTAPGNVTYSAVDDTLDAGYPGSNDYFEVYAVSGGAQTYSGSAPLTYPVTIPGSAFPSAGQYEIVHTSSDANNNAFGDRVGTSYLYLQTETRFIVNK